MAQRKKIWRKIVTEVFDDRLLEAQIFFPVDVAADLEDVAVARKREEL